MHKKSHKQRGGSLHWSNLDDETPVMSERLSSGVHLNTVQGFGADLNRPPLEEWTANQQCNDNM